MKITQTAQKIKLNQVMNLPVVCQNLVLLGNNLSKGLLHIDDLRLMGYNQRMETNALILS